MIWCIEDDAGIRDLEVYTLSSTGFEACGFADGEEMRKALKTEMPELIILDVMLPGEDGTSILKYIRGNPATASIPIIMATAKGMEYDKVSALDLGADDYLVKPFGMMEMVSRVKAILRRVNPDRKKSHVLKIKGLTLNCDERTVFVDDGKVILTFKEFELLKLLMSSPGVAFSRDRIFEDIWGESFIGESRTMDMHIRTLRSKLGQYGKLIETVRGVGYKLEANGD